MTSFITFLAGVFLGMVSISSLTKSSLPETNIDEQELARSLANAFIRKHGLQAQHELLSVMNDSSIRQFPVSIYTHALIEIDKQHLIAGTDTL